MPTRTSPASNGPWRPTARCDACGSSTSTLAARRFTIEFVALANHRKAIRAEIARYAERFRAAQLDAVTAALETHGVADRMPPIVALLLMTGLSQVLAIEQALGVTEGHDATVAYIEDAIGRLEPG